MVLSILFVSGVNDLSTIGVTLDDEGRFGHLIDGNCSIHHRLPLKEGIASSLLIFGKGVPQRGIEFKTPPSLIFNQIADPDTHRGALERCVELCEQINTTVINHPRHVLQTSRDRVSEKLQGIPGVVMPRTQRFRPRSPDEVFSRAAAEGFDFPFIARVAGLHGGKSMIRVNGREDHAALHALPFDGRDFYLVEYVDCRDENGFHHKQRILVIDGEPLLRHTLYNSDWNVHGISRAFMLERESWEEDIARFARLRDEMLPPLRPAITEIARRLQLEYFGMDCNMRPDGQLLVFEANANMNVLHGRTPQTLYRREAVIGKLHALLTKYSGERVV
jgi:glutathione synthase/RimK-type ligase-like ATP-grasp enzyme